MRRRLPPLSTLPSFEATARLLSFSRAADELGVTHGAVSRAVRNLEDQLGVRLMIRATRSVRLTPAGVSFAAEVADALERLAVAASTAAGRSSSIVNVSTIDSFAARWLMPRLPRFRRAHSGIDVRVSMSERLADFVNDGIDLAIRCGGGRYPGMTSELLMTEDHFPVCSPKLLQGRRPLRSPADLLRHTLLHDVFTVDWAVWLQSAGIEHVHSQRGPTFLSSDHAIQAAVRGEGVILGRSALIADELASGRLVRPFEFKLPASFAYYAVYPARALKRASVKAFRDWLIAEARTEAKRGRVTSAPATAAAAGRSVPGRAGQGAARAVRRRG
ncbi:transcriptional regulator GcvA [Reyranella sp. CPCC 100927]|nr:transcriptional regulator GcvA [Reyranella sp. CPCC 100927]TWT13099.1 transcriptional regulator GcvA [Reyranella sp. CPCC 100927]